MIMLERKGEEQEEQAEQAGRLVTAAAAAAAAAVVVVEVVLRVPVAERTCSPSSATIGTTQWAGGAATATSTHASWRATRGARDSTPIARPGCDDDDDVFNHGEANREINRNENGTKETSLVFGKNT